MKGRASRTTLLLRIFHDKVLGIRQRLGSVIETRRYLLLVGFRIFDKEFTNCLII